jgi:LytS/YehU family sensor histidine kinase
VSGTYYNHILFFCRKGKRKGVKRINIYGVQIDLNPDIILYKKGTDRISGAIKLIFSKNRQITPMEGQVIAGIIKSTLEKKFKLSVDSKNVLH